MEICRTVPRLAQLTSRTADPCKLNLNIMSLLIRRRDVVFVKHHHNRFSHHYHSKSRRYSDRKSKDAIAPAPSPASTTHNHHHTHAINTSKLLFKASLPSISSPLLLLPPNKPTQLPNISFLRRFFTTTTSSVDMSAAKVKAQKIIDENAVAVFSKSYCPYCKATKALLTASGANYYTIELDQVEDGSDIQNALREINGQSSVPNIYIKQEHIGGNSDLQARKSELPALLKAAGAL